jgi:hypothetical protein
MSVGAQRRECPGPVPRHVIAVNSVTAGNRRGCVQVKVRRITSSEGSSLKVDVEGGRGREGGL